MDIVFYSDAYYIFENMNGGIQMLNFEEELKKFQPSMDIEQTQDAVYSNKYEDVTDVVKELLKELGSR